MKQYIRMALSAVLIILGVVLTAQGVELFLKAWFLAIWYLVALLPTSQMVVIKALDRINCKDWMAQPVLMTASVLILFCSGHFLDAAATMLCFRIGIKLVDILTGGHASHKDARRSELELRLEKNAKSFAPSLIALAVAVIVVAYVYYYTAKGAEFSFADWLCRSMVFVALGCPLTLTACVPLAYSSGLNSARMRGIFFGGGHYLDLLARTDTLVVEDEAILDGEQDKPGTLKAFLDMRCSGIGVVEILSDGDQEEAELVAGRLQTDSGYGCLEGKERWPHIQELQNAGCRVAYVGVPGKGEEALRQADAGIVMGGEESDISEQACNIAIPSAEPARLCEARYLAQESRSQARQGIAFTLLAKAILCILGALGIIPVWAAVAIDVAVALLCMLRTRRL